MICVGNKPVVFELALKLPYIIHLMYFFYDSVQGHKEIVKQLVDLIGITSIMEVGFVYLGYFHAFDPLKGLSFFFKSFYSLCFLMRLFVHLVWLQRFWYYQNILVVYNA